MCRAGLLGRETRALVLDLLSTCFCLPLPSLPSLPPTPVIATQAGRSPGYHVMAGGLSCHLIAAGPSSWECKQFSFSCILIYGQNSVKEPLPSIGAGRGHIFSFHLFSFQAPFFQEKPFRFPLGPSVSSPYSPDSLSDMELCPWWFIGGQGTNPGQSIRCSSSPCNIFPRIPMWLTPYFFLISAQISPLRVANAHPISNRTPRSPPSARLIALPCWRSHCGTHHHTT